MGIDLRMQIHFAAVSCHVGGREVECSKVRWGGHLTPSRPEGVFHVH